MVSNVDLRHRGALVWTLLICPGDGSAGVPRRSEEGQSWAWSGGRRAERPLDELLESGSWHALLMAEPDEGQTAIAGGVFPLDGQLVSLRPTDLENLGGLLNGEERG